MVIKFCVSWITIHVMQDAIKTFIQSWNNHRIPGREGGIPNVMAFHNNEVTVLNPTFIPSTSEVIRINENDGRQLCRNYSYGRDPLCGRTQLQELRERDFFALFPDFRVVFEDVLHNDGHLFRRCILQFIQLTENFAALHLTAFFMQSVCHAVQKSCF